MTNATTRRLAGSHVEIPLPGSFEVLTLQLNATVYPRARTGKFVVILRDPIEQLEIVRLGVPEQRLEDLLPQLDAACREAVRQALYMGGLDAYTGHMEASPPI